MTTESPGSPAPAITHLSQFIALADPGFFFLQNHSWNEVHSESDFTASLAVGKMILKAITQDPSIMPRLIVEQSIEVRISAPR